MKKKVNLGEGIKWVKEKSCGVNKFHYLSFFHFKYIYKFSLLHSLTRTTTQNNQTFIHIIFSFFFIFKKKNNNKNILKIKQFSNFLRFFFSYFFLAVVVVLFIGFLTYFYFFSIERVSYQQIFYYTYILIYWQTCSLCCWWE